jgi:hypothetical protein
MKRRNEVAWKDNTIGSRDKGVRPQGLRLFIYSEDAHLAQPGNESGISTA